MTLSHKQRDLLGDTELWLRRRVVDVARRLLTHVAANALATWVEVPAALVLRHSATDFIGEHIRAVLLGVLVARTAVLVASFGDLAVAAILRVRINAASIGLRMNAVVTLDVPLIRLIAVPECDCRIVLGSVVPAAARFL